MRGGDKTYPKTKIVLYERGEMDITRVRNDLSKNAIWFLRKSKDETRYVIDRADYAQPLKFKPYFAVLLSEKPDAGIAGLLKHKDPEIRLRVLDYLMGLHRPEHAAVIAALFEDSNEKVQALAARAAAEVGDFSAVLLFRKALAHKNPEVRAIACAFLCRFRDVESIPAIGKVLPGMCPFKQQWVAKNLRRMESRRVVALLLELLDEHVTPGKPPHEASYSVSSNAAESLIELTGVHFPLNTGDARKLWENLKSFPDEVLIRKRIQADIESLTHADYDVRWAAYRRLGRLVGNHFGSYDAFHRIGGQAGREESQRALRKWGQRNLTRSRLDWIYDGFKASGIDLPRPMNKKGIDTLIEALTCCRNWGRQGVYNANLLLECHTGHKVGLSPYHHDLCKTWKQHHVLENRWADWWRQNRDKIALRPWLAEKPVSKEMLSKAPNLLPPSKPLQVTIRMSKEVFSNTEPVVVSVQLKNVSSKVITIAKRPKGLRYGSRSGSGSSGHSALSGQKREDFVTLKPGQIMVWDEKAAFSHYSKPCSIEGFYYRLLYPFAGSQFGLRAWRGELMSNKVNYALTN